MADDPCECIWNHEAAMRRLLSLLRDTQTECTEGECSTGGTSSGQQGMMMWSMLWGMLALALFFMRPRSLRGGGQNAEPAAKPSTSSFGGNNDHDDPPPPPGVQ